MRKILLAMLAVLLGVTFTYGESCKKSPIKVEYKAAEDSCTYQTRTCCEDGNWSDWDGKCPKKMCMHQCYRPLSNHWWEGDFGGSAEETYKACKERRDQQAEEEIAGVTYTYKDTSTSSMGLTLTTTGGGETLIYYYSNPKEDGSCDESLWLNGRFGTGLSDCYRPYPDSQPDIWTYDYEIFTCSTKYIDESKMKPRAKKVWDCTSSDTKTTEYECPDFAANGADCTDVLMVDCYKKVESTKKTGIDAVKHGSKTGSKTGKTESKTDSKTDKESFTHKKYEICGCHITGETFVPILN